MKQKKEIKISLTLAIILIIIFIAIIFTMSIFIININKKQNLSKTENSIGNNTIHDKTQENVDNKDFTMGFLKLENNKENTIYSPLSIKYALKMLNEGANGNTKAQIENVINDLNVTKYDNIPNVLSLANGIYVRDTYSKYIKKEFENKLIENYNAEVMYDPFKDATNINKWIENKTLKIIKNMLTDNMIQNPNTKVLLINALAIDMQWKEPFDTNKTYGEEFNLANGNKMKATMMHKETSKDNISYYKDKEITSVIMDLEKYENTQMEFIAIMPNNNNLADYIKTFSTQEVNDITNKSKLASEAENGIEIFIPKFSFDYNLKLKNDLIELGITDAFKESLADFSNMSNNGLYVSDALHKANIDFTEKGVKAAAVTVFAMMDNAMIVEKTKPEEIKIDKPFLYLIRDKNTKEIWFVGTVYEPNSWEEDKADYGY